MPNALVKYIFYLPLGFNGNYLQKEKGKGETSQMLQNCECSAVKVQQTAIFHPFVIIELLTLQSQQKAAAGCSSLAKKQYLANPLVLAGQSTLKEGSGATMPIQGGGYEIELNWIEMLLYIHFNTSKGASKWAKIGRASRKVPGRALSLEANQRNCQLVNSNSNST